MKKIILLLLVASAVIANDTTDVHDKDTVITKVINTNDNTLITVLTFTLPIFVSLLVLYLSNRHNSKINNKQINVATRRKLIDDLIGSLSSIDALWFDIEATTNSLAREILELRPLNDDTDFDVDMHTSYLNKCENVSDNFVQIVKLILRVPLLMSIDSEDYLTVILLQRKFINSVSKYMSVFTNENYFGNQDFKRQLNKMRFVASQRYQRYYDNMKLIIEREKTEINRKV